MNYLKDVFKITCFFIVLAIGMYYCFGGWYVSPQPWGYYSLIGAPFYMAFLMRFDHYLDDYLDEQINREKQK